MSSFLVSNSGAFIFAFCMLLCFLYALIFSCGRHRAGAVRTTTGRFAKPGLASWPSTRFVCCDDGSKESVAVGAAAGHTCAVCLGPAAEGEMARRVPECRRVFHVECIDKWLRSHSLCPVCRADKRPPWRSYVAARQATGKPWFKCTC